jgi:hypothetical protein
MTIIHSTDNNPDANSTFKKLEVQWLNLALCFYQSLCSIESELLQNRQLRVAAKSYKQSQVKRTVQA